MKKWSEDMTEAFQLCDKGKIISMLRLGFPTELSLCIRGREGGILVGRTYPAHLCCEYGFLDILEELVARGCFIDAKDSFKRSPLMIACENGHVEIIRYLITSCKVPLKGFDYAGNTILHLAAVNGRLEVVKYLVEEIGLNVNLLSLNKKTALETCRHLYIIEYTPALEKTIGYLLAKSSKARIGGVPEESVFHGMYAGSCHDHCKERYCQSIAAKKIGLNIRYKSIAVLEKYVPTTAQAFQGPGNLRSSYQKPNTIDQTINEKCQKIYKIIRSIEPFKVLNRRNTSKNNLSHTTLTSSKSSALPMVKNSVT